MADAPVINPSNPPVVDPTNGINPSDLMAQIQKQLLNSSSSISSSNSKLEDAIGGAITSTKAVGKQSHDATASDFDTKIADATKAGASAVTSFEEAQRGYATNNAALKQLKDDTAKSISDLTKAKDSALASGDLATNTALNGLIIQKYQFEQKAQQDVFSNLVSMNNMVLQGAQEKRLQQTQNFTEDQAKQSIALKYGIEVKPGDTMQDIVNRAKPFASAEEKLQLDQATANLALTKANAEKANADAVKALRDSKATAPIDNTSVKVIAQNLKDAGGTANAIKAQLATSAGVVDKAAAYAIVDELFAEKDTSSSGGAFSTTPGTFNSPLLNFGAKVGEIAPKPGKAILDFIFGKNFGQ